MLLDKGLMTLFLQNATFLHHLSFYLFKTDSRCYCESVINTDRTHIFLFFRFLKCNIFLLADIQVKTDSYITRESIYILQICFIDNSFCYCTHINGYYLSTCLTSSPSLSMPEHLWHARWNNPPSHLPCDQYPA